MLYRTFFCQINPYAESFILVCCNRTTRAFRNIGCKVGDAIKDVLLIFVLFQESTIGVTLLQMDGTVTKRAWM